MEFFTTKYKRFEVKKCNVICQFKIKESGKMAESRIKSIPKKILLRIFGMVLFLSFLLMANFLPFFTENPLNYQVIQFLNENIGLVILMGVTFLFGEIFNALIFPFNLPAPLFNASGSLLLVAFISS